MSDNSSNLYPDKMGNRSYSLAALQERIEDAFAQETHGRPDILSELDTRPKRRAAITEVTDYILSTEYVTLPTEVKRELIDNAVANLFYFGALDRYLQDEAITEITIENITQVAARRGFEQIETLTSPFHTLPDVEDNLNRLIAPTGTALMQEYPFQEVGLNLYDRPLRLSVIAPPISPMYSVQLRLHPSQPITFEALTPLVLPAEAMELLINILNSGRGLLVTGEVGVGKTTVVSALLNHLELKNVTVVERATEMQLSEGITRLAAVPPKPADSSSAVEFDAQIMNALEDAPQTIVLDEIRGDESIAFWNAIQHVPQPIAIFRGTHEPDRLLSAVSMAIRKKQWGIEAETIHQALLEKLPFVVALHKFPNQSPRLTLLAQWVAVDETLTLQPLVEWGQDTDPVRTDHAPNLD